MVILGVSVLNLERSGRTSCPNQAERLAQPTARCPRREGRLWGGQTSCGQIVLYCDPGEDHGRVHFGTSCRFLHIG